MKHEPVRVRWWRKLPPIVRGFVYASLALGLIIAAVWPYRFRIIGNDGLAYVALMVVTGAFLIGAGVFYLKERKIIPAACSIGLGVLGIYTAWLIGSIPGFI